MNVRELIEKLQKYDGEMKVSFMDREGSYSEIDYVEVVDTTKPYTYCSPYLDGEKQILNLG